MKVIRFFLFLAFSCTAAAKDFAAEFEARYVLPLLIDSPGGAMVVVENGKVALQRTYGVRDIRSGEPVTRETLFRIASLSKTFASAAAVKLVDETPLTWQSPLRANLPGLRFKEPEKGDRINLRHVLSQSTGLMPHAYTNLIEERMSYDRILERLDRVDFICEPGDCYSYQNVVFSLVGDLVETQTGESYADFVGTRLFKPLTMRRASMGHKAFVADPDRAEGHVWTGREWRAVRTSRNYYKVLPAAGVNASIADMEQWLLAHLGKRPDVLDKPALDELHEGVVRTSRYQAHYPRRKGLGNVHYGLGWRVFDFGDLAGFVHHGGYVKGMVSAMVLHRSTGTGMVLLANAEVRGLNELVLDFAELYSRYYPAGTSSQLVSR